MRPNPIENRRRLLRLVETFPGLHLSDLGRRAKMSEPLAVYHAAALVEAGLVEARGDGVYVRYYPLRSAAPSSQDQALVGLLRQPVPLNIALLLFERGRATQTDLARELDLAKSTVSYHVARLAEAGLIEVTDEGIALREADRVRRVLTRWEPPRDVTRRFAALWRNFYSVRGGR